MSSQNISLRVNTELVERIDASAVQAGQTRTDYILSYLPETYDRTTEPDEQRSNEQRR